MATRMLIDARHPEETRVAVLAGNRIEEFDFESAEHKQIKGNIYLAKVTRVEPSLQAAFVDFGGGRHGFLAFGEIHPDYYQIPAADRAALLAEDQAAADEEAALREQEDDEGSSPGRDYSDEEDEDEDEDDGLVEIDTSEKDEVSVIEDGRLEDDGDSDEDDDSGEDDDADPSENSDDEPEDDDGTDASGEDRGGRGGRRRGRRQGRGRGRSGDNRNEGGDNGNSDNRGRGNGGRGGGSRAKEIDDVRARRQALRRRYKIQDVIQRRQVLLVQVVKEERGNKGAALTTYLSLAGRYCVLMPNSTSGGGISRKISGGQDRKRLKQIVDDLALPRSMGLIVRTAGLERNKTEIKRDFDYLARLWDEIREQTLASSAPSVIHSDNDLIKRAIRDIYTREIEEVVVEGPEGFRAAKEFMKLLMPSHARRVKQYADPVPLFQRYGAEDQLSAMYEPVVQLKSGGYLVINPTEALVSIDINSGRSTREHGIEQTALSTNLEAAREIARQLRLRDMAGLVVIDFIDMEQNSSNRKVEKAVKEALKNDRARIQVGRISGFGLMEMSRQRLRTGVLEASTRQCPHCDGTGLVRTASSAGLAALRLIEDEAAKGKGSLITLYASREAAIYLLNTKRADLAEIEARYHVAVEVVPDGENEGAKMRIASSGPRPLEAPRFEMLAEDEDDEPADIAEDEDEDDEESATDQGGGDEDRQGSGQSRRTREHSEDDEGGDGERKKRRRRRRGGRGRNRSRDNEGDSAGDGDGGDGDARDEQSGSRNEPDDDQASGDASAAPAEQGGDATVDGDEAKPARRRRSSRRRDPAASDTQAESDTQDEAETQGEAQAEAKSDERGDQPPPPRPRRRKAAARSSGTDEAASDAADQNEAGHAGEPDPTSATSDEQQSAPAKPRGRRRKSEADLDEASSEQTEPAPSPAKRASKPAPARRSRAKADPADEDASADSTSKSAASASKRQPKEQAVVSEPAGSASDDRTSSASDGGDGDDAAPPRRGWWQRTFGA